MSREHVVKELREHKGLYLPNYKQNIFSVVPTALRFLDVDVNRQTLLNTRSLKRVFEDTCCMDAENVVCLVVDSVGVHQLPCFTHLFDAWSSLGRLKLSSVFPTITSAAIVSIHFGIPPERHGIVGHKVRFKQLGTVVDTLKMASVKSLSVDRLVKSGIDVRVLLLENGFYDELKNKEVAHVELMPSDIAGTGLSHLLEVEDVTVGFSNVVDAFSTLRKVLDKFEGKKKIVNVYFGLMDDISHKYGPLSEEYRLAAHHVEEVFTHFLKGLSGKTERTVFLFFSDHGQGQVHEEKTVKVSEDDAEDVSRFMESPPGRSGRVCHFYVKEGEEERVKDWIEGKVGENGVVLSFEELCRSFNLQVKGKNREELKSRMGNLVLVLKGEAELKFQRKEKEEKEKIVEEKWRGSHGSTTLNEILVPLIAARGDVLKEVLGVRSR